MLPLLLAILIQSRPLNGMPLTYLLPTDPGYLAQEGCFWDGKWYQKNSDISRGSDGNGLCYGLYCDHDGNLQPWDDFDCATTHGTPPIPTTPPLECDIPECTTQSETTTPLEQSTAAFPTTQPTTTESPSPSTTAVPTTSPAPSPTTVPIPLGCLQNGAWYEPGSEISRESDGEGWCHGISCDANGKIVAWDDWDCEAAATDYPPSTQVEPQGCYYENQWHPYGSIFEGSDSNGCKYGAICGMDGHVTRWDEFDCQSTKKQ